jgi:hypothetical protein
MIKFYRKIRQNLLMENKTGKYLKYAIGEIILVVIGILLALQINNWNENRKLKEKEISNIQNLVEEIGFNNTILKSLNEVDSTSLIVGKKMLTILKNKDSKYKDSMSYDFSKMLDSRIFISRRTAYENLKSIDFNVIKSDSIRMNLSFIYDGLYSYLDNEQNTKRNESSKQIKNIIQNNFERIEGNEIVPNDYEDLKKNKNFTNALSFYIYHKQESYEQNVEYYLWLEKIRLELEDYLTEIEI